MAHSIVLRDSLLFKPDTSFVTISGSIPIKKVNTFTNFSFSVFEIEDFSNANCNVFLRRAPRFISDGFDVNTVQRYFRNALS